MERLEEVQRWLLWIDFEEGHYWMVRELGIDLNATATISDPDKKLH